MSVYSSLRKPTKKKSLILQMICCARISYLRQKPTISNLRCLFPILSEMIVILFVFLIVLSVNLQRIYLQITTSPTALISLPVTLSNRNWTKRGKSGLKSLKNSVDNVPSSWLIGTKESLFSFLSWMEVTPLKLQHQSVLFCLNPV